MQIVNCIYSTSICQFKFNKSRIDTYFKTVVSTVVWLIFINNISLDKAKTIHTPEIMSPRTTDTMINHAYSISV